MSSRKHQTYSDVAETAADKGLKSFDKELERLRDEQTRLTAEWRTKEANLQSQLRQEQLTIKTLQIAKGAAQTETAVRIRLSSDDFLSSC